MPVQIVLQCELGHQAVPSLMPSQDMNGFVGITCGIYQP